MGNTEQQAFLAALHLASPALPVGGFAYSQGLEQAIEEGWVRDQSSASRWIHDLMLLGLARQELPLWAACHAAVIDQDKAALSRHNAQLHSLRETAEFRLETLQMGQSAAKLFAHWPQAEGASRIPTDINNWTYPAAHACLCAASGVALECGMVSYLWSWAENQVLAAVKHVPLGQTAGQSMLHALKAAIPQAVATALATPLEHIGSATFGLAITSSNHETQYSRLFRS